MKYHERARAILRSGLPARHKAVLLALSDHVDAHMECYPSIGRLAAETSLADRTVRRTLRELEADGHVRTAHSQGRHASVYRLHLDALPEAPTRTEDPPNPDPPSPLPGSEVRVEPNPDRVSPLPGSSVPPTRIHSPPNPDRVSGPSERAKNDPRTIQGNVAPEAPGTADAALLSELWSALVAFTASPAAWKLSQARRKQLRARVAEDGPDAVREVAAWVRTSKHERAAFLRERGDPTTLIRASNFGTYLAFARSGGPAAQQPRNGHNAEALARKALGDLERLLLLHGPAIPEAARGASERDRRAWLAGVDAMGGLFTIGQQEARYWPRSAFVDAYVAEHGRRA